ncbi:MAPEG family protein [uncultured Maritalea sp.]|uniref:MAPEG family protein n=1 Tax=uncultured Maritalea sp. TaxID=757249 RepID=UPI002611D8AD|nr:MAPEG family protein [uncultured Maritalea sp.]
MVGAEKLLLVAVFAQVFLTFAVLIILGHRRVPLVFQEKIKVADIALDGEAWPLGAKLASNNFANQFQLPIMFYALAAVALATEQVTMWLAILGVLFVLSRYIHAAIHISKNRVYRRFFAYVTGMAILAIMWLGFAIQTLIL